MTYPNQTHRSTTDYGADLAARERDARECESLNGDAGRFAEAPSDIDELRAILAARKERQQRKEQRS